jgi:hypothetical protein
MSLKALVPIIAAVIAAETAVAQAPDLQNRSFLEAAMVVVSYDHFESACGRRISAENAAKLATWRTTNGIERIRARARVLEADPANRSTFAQLRTGAVEPLQRENMNPCDVVMAISRLPAAQFAKTAPEMLAALPANGGAVATAAPGGSATGGGTPARPASPPITTPTTSSAVMSQIESFGFDTRATMGVGGFVGLAVYPVVLFKNGEALTDVEGLNFAGGIAAHKKANPDDWTQWRRAAGKLQTMGSRGWSNLAYQVTYGRLPDGFRLNGTYRAMSGTGNVAIGGDASVVAWNQYTFTPDGRVVRGGGAGASNATVATGSVQPNQRGQYRVEGLMLNITYDDGSRESRMLITDPADAKGAIWLDGTGYAQRRP